MQLQNKPMNQAQNIQPLVFSLRQHLGALLIPKDTMSDQGQLTLGKVNERLQTLGELNLDVYQKNPLADVLQQLAQANAVVNAALPKHCQNIVRNVSSLAQFLPWYQRSVANN